MLKQTHLLVTIITFINYYLNSQDDLLSFIVMKIERVHRNFIVNNISSRLKCPICYDIFYKPRRLFCGHTFCKPCLKELRNNHDNLDHQLSCPLCREAINPKKKIINELQVTCPRQGCTWTGQNQLLQTHHRFDCTMQDKLAMSSQKASRCSSQWSINILESDQQYIKEEDEEEQQVQFDFQQRISAQEYRYKQIKPVQGNKIFVVSRGVQTNDSSPSPPPALEKRRRRRRRKSLQGSFSEGPKIRRRRRSKKTQVKVQESVSIKSKISRQEQMKDIEQLYKKMGFDFHATYESAEKTVKPIQMNVDKPKSIMKERW